MKFYVPAVTAHKARWHRRGQHDMGAVIGAEVFASRLQPQDTCSSDSRTRDLGTWAPSSFSSSAPPTHSIALPIFLYVKYFCKVCAWQQLTQTAQHPGSQQRQHPGWPRPRSLGNTAEHSPPSGTPTTSHGSRVRVDPRLINRYTSWFPLEISQERIFL